MTVLFTWRKFLTANNNIYVTNELRTSENVYCSQVRANITLLLSFNIFHGRNFRISYTKEELRCSHCNFNRTSVWFPLVLQMWSTFMALGEIKEKKKKVRNNISASHEFPLWVILIDCGHSHWCCTLIIKSKKKNQNLLCQSKSIPSSILLITHKYCILYISHFLYGCMEKNILSCLLKLNPKKQLREKLNEAVC